MEFLFIILVTVVPLAAWIVFDALIKSSRGQSLANRFFEMGDLKGKTLEQIVEVVGQPQFMATWPDGRLAVEWAHGTYQIALVFKDNACEGVLGEQVVQPQYSTGVSSGVIIGE